MSDRDSGLCNLSTFRGTSYLQIGSPYVLGTSNIKKNSLKSLIFHRLLIGLYNLSIETFFKFFWLRYIYMFCCSCFLPTTMCEHVHCSKGKIKYYVARKVRYIIFYNLKCNISWHKSLATPWWPNVKAQITIKRDMRW